MSTEFGIHRLNRLANWLETVNEYTGRIVSWFTLAMVLMMFMVVVLRYAFDFGRIWLQESVVYLHALVFLIGAAYTLKHDAHVRVDIFYSKFSARKKAIVDLMGTLFLLMPTCVFIAWMSWSYIVQSWSLLEGSREAGGLPGVFLLKSLILLFVFLLLMQGVASALSNLARLLGHHDEHSTDEGR